MNKRDTEWMRIPPNFPSFLLLRMKMMCRNLNLLLNFFMFSTPRLPCFCCGGCPRAYSCASEGICGWVCVLCQRWKIDRKNEMKYELISFFTKCFSPTHHHQHQHQSKSSRTKLSWVKGGKSVRKIRVKNMKIRWLMENVWGECGRVLVGGAKWNSRNYTIIQPAPAPERTLGLLSRPFHPLLSPAITFF